MSSYRGPAMTAEECRYLSNPITRHYKITKALVKEMVWARWKDTSKQYWSVFVPEDYTFLEYELSHLGYGVRTERVARSWDTHVTPHKPMEYVLWIAITWEPREEALDAVWFPKTPMEDRTIRHNPGLPKDERLIVGKIWDITKDDM